MENLKEVLQFYQEIGAEYLNLGDEMDGYITIPVKTPPSGQGSLEEVNRRIYSCQKCPLHQTKQHYVPGEGSLNPDIMFIGEGPGRDEDLQGKPFVGKAGALLDKLILKMGYRRSDLFIGNIVKCRPPKNRDPQPPEVAACIPYLKEQIKIIHPRVIVCLGKVAMNNLLNRQLSIMKVHGQEFEFEGIPVIPTIHPSYILHQSNRGKEAVSSAKWMMWEDIQHALARAKKN